jgi:hypothetical protein
LDASPNDLWSTPVVERKADNFDTRKPDLDIDEKGRICTIKPVNRLSWITDKKQVVAIGAQQVDKAMLERVKVLSFVDEQVSETPPQSVGKFAVVFHVANDEAEHIIKVDDAPLAFHAFKVAENGGYSLNTDVWLTAFTARYCRVMVGIYASCRRPVDFLDETIETDPL